MKEQLVQQLIDGAGLVLVSVITWAVAQLMLWLRAHTTNTRLLLLLDHVEQTVSTCVVAAEQTTVKVLKASATLPDGTLRTSLSSEEAARVKGEVVDAIRAALGPKVQAETQALLGLGEAAFLDLLRAKVESNVYFRQGGK